MSDPSHSFADRAALFVATGCGVGYAPVMPGTVGSVWGVAMMIGWQQIGWPEWTGLLLGAAMFGLGVPLCSRAAAVLKVKDPGSIVFDEIAAFPFIFAFIEVTWLSAVMGFVWFRLFDVLKPWPCSRLDKLPGGLGVMADDAAAAAYAAIALWGTLRLVS
ncbi:MAG: phosphatidylglycerophosphatase A [Planctomycetaceae bacterium]